MPFQKFFVILLIVIKRGDEKIHHNRKIIQETFFGREFKPVACGAILPINKDLTEVRIIEITTEEKTEIDTKEETGIHHVLMTAKITSDGKIKDTKYDQSWVLGTKPGEAVIKSYLPIKRRTLYIAV